MTIPPGSYTRDTLPPISKEAQRILEEVRATGEKHRAEHPELYQFLAGQKITPALIGSLLGAKGYLSLKDLMENEGQGGPS